MPSRVIFCMLNFFDDRLHVFVDFVLQLAAYLLSKSSYQKQLKSCISLIFFKLNVLASILFFVTHKKTSQIRLPYTFSVACFLAGIVRIRFIAESKVATMVATRIFATRASRDQLVATRASRNQLVVNILVATMVATLDSAMLRHNLRVKCCKLSPMICVSLDKELNFALNDILNHS